MRHSLLLAVLVALSLPAHAASPGDVVNAFHQALARGDAPAAIALLSPEVKIYESGYVERARGEYAAHHLSSDMVFAKGTTERILDSSERVAGNLAMVMRETEVIGSYKGRGVHSFGTETAVLEKKGDGWVIVHVHWSSRKGS
jgi:ketosteroid isomerase-like protein